LRQLHPKRLWQKLWWLRQLQMTRRRQRAHKEFGFLPLGALSGLLVWASAPRNGNLEELGQPKRIWGFGQASPQNAALKFRN
jgi:hypothetical protein